MPQELRLCGISTMEDANTYLRETYLREFNERFSVVAAEAGTAFVPCTHTDLERVFSLLHERVVARDNTVRFAHLSLQIERQRWRGTLSGCRVIVYEHLDGTLSVGFGAHPVGRYSADGRPLAAEATTDEAANKLKAAKRRAA